MITANSPGVQQLGNGATTTEQRITNDGAIVNANGHGRYTELVYRSGLFSLSSPGATPTAYIGGAGGTPLLAIHNPTNSGKNLVLIGLYVGNRVAASAAGTVTFNLWGGPSVQPTSTPTTPKSLNSLNQSGSVALGFNNTALTSSTALLLLFPVFTYYWATAAGAFAAPGYFDVGGTVMVAPGNQVAFGATTALTSAVWDVAMTWEEISI